jgi:NTP pyrophosphatase (non-canonical NTP hydrolase)
MTLNEYQERAIALALPQTRHNLNYMMFGLANEAGEATGKMKKYVRQDYGMIALQEGLLGELGDVLWYVSGAAKVLGFTLEEIAQVNIDKLEDRKQRNKLQGDGDNR